MELILASTSPYRKRLLERLQMPFRCEAPGVEETATAGETASGLAGRLALGKARAVRARFPTALVIGSDQVADVDGLIMGKPGGYEAARRQLNHSSGKEVHFHTGLSLCGPGLELTHVEPFRVAFRALTGAEIDYYLRLEQPYDCAGSFKCEGLGIALFSRMTGDDPTSLEGLPLISLVRMLAEAGVTVLAPGRR
jgi:septum formation protein